MSLNESNMNNNKIQSNDLSKTIIEIRNLIGVSQSIVISTHMNPDGDALGSALGLCYFLKSIGKDAAVIISDPVPDNLAFLPGTPGIKQWGKDDCIDTLDKADLFIIVDLNSIGRLKELGNEIVCRKASKIIIDHHINPGDFADFYMVDTKCSSTGELIWRLISGFKEFKPNADIATNLYTAIMTDTGSFRFPRTTSEVHRIIAELIEAGADPVMIYDEVYCKMPATHLKLMGMVFSNLESYFDGRLNIVKIPKSFFEISGASEDEIEGFVEKTLFTSDVVVGILITEVIDRNELRVSFRSKGNFSVRKLAEKFGGGGHDNAAGARVKDQNIDEFYNTIIAEAGDMFFNN